MTAPQFQARVLEILKGYWRAKAANAFYSTLESLPFDTLEYTHVPSFGIAVNSFPNESLTEAIQALNDFIANRLPRDLFFALISEYEARISARLTALGQPSDGTLGQLQVRVQNVVSVAQDIVNDAVEVRERRNAMIHHADLAHQKYVNAAATVVSRASPFVKVVVAGNNVSPNEQYLTYAADVLVRYSNAIG